MNESSKSTEQIMTKSKEIKEVKDDQSIKEIE